MIYDVPRRAIFSQDPSEIPTPNKQFCLDEKDCRHHWDENGPNYEYQVVKTDTICNGEFTIYFIPDIGWIYDVYLMFLD